MASDLPIYLILGHGTEKVVELNEREKLPEGSTLVTYSESGNASFMEEVCKTLHLFKNPENLELLADPVEHRNELEEELNHSIRIYKPGTGIPELNISPLTTWDFYNMKHVKTYQLMKSGVYRFPLTEELLFDSPFYKMSNEEQEILLKKQIVNDNIEQCSESIVYMNWKNFDEEIIRKVYEGAIYPSEDVVETIANIKSSPSAIGNKLTISLKTLIEKLGPGIYYYVICRADNEFYNKHSTAIESFFLTEEHDIVEETYPGYFKGDKGKERLKAVKAFEEAMNNAKKSIENRNTIRMLKRFIRFLQDYPENIPEFEALPEEYKAYVLENQIVPSLQPFLNYIEKMERIRRVSVVQQNKTRARRGGGKKKQTRKRRRGL